MAPIKRHKALHPLSREHHHTLLLGWKIKKGIHKGIAPERIKKYADWYFINHLLPHFEEEEISFGKILDANDTGLLQMQQEHNLIKETFNKKTDEQTLIEIAGLLEKHVRFEERDLFNRVQAIATEQQLEDLYAAENADEKFRDNEEDTFWI